MQAAVIDGRVLVVPGHGFAGDITTVGSDATAFQEVDLVRVDLNESCGCRWCRVGAKNLRDTLNPVGVQGTGPRRSTSSAALTAGLSDRLDGISGALIEPLSCVLHASERVPDLQPPPS